MATVLLSPLTPEDRDRFILDNQEAFRFGATEEFGVRDERFEEEGEIISRRTIEHALDDTGAEAYRIVENGENIGGVVLKIDPVSRHNELALFFVTPRAHGRGVGYAAWLEVEKLHPETKVWETCTPYFEKRNIHFYINKCGFHATAFYNRYLPDPHPAPEDEIDEGEDGGVDEMFYFEKVMPTPEQG